MRRCADVRRDFLALKYLVAMLDAEQAAQIDRTSDPARKLVYER